MLMCKEMLFFPSGHWVSGILPDPNIDRKQKIKKHCLKEDRCEKHLLKQYAYDNYMFFLPELTPIFFVRPVNITLSIVNICFIFELMGLTDFKNIFTNTIVIFIFTSARKWNRSASVI